MRLYDITVNSVRCTQHLNAPVLDCCFTDENHIYTGGLAKEVRLYDAITGQSDLIGYHEGVVSKVHYLNDIHCVATGSWDNTVRLWDARARSSTSPTHTLPHQSYVYTMDSCEWKIVVGTNLRKVFVWDLRQLSRPLQNRDSSLKYQTRCIRCFPNGQGYVISSIEGRICVEYFDMSVEAQKRKYAFKCHRKRVGDMEYVYSVNAIAFHREYNTFASGGSDNFVNVWDPFHQKRLDQLQEFPLAVHSLAFSQDGSVLAIGSSDMNEKDSLEADVTPREGLIYIRYVNANEVRPKTTSIA